MDEIEFNISFGELRGKFTCTVEEWHSMTEGERTEFIKAKAMEIAIPHIRVSTRVIMDPMPFKQGSGVKVFVDDMKKQPPFGNFR